MCGRAGVDAAGVECGAARRECHARAAEPPRPLRPLRGARARTLIAFMGGSDWSTTRNSSERPGGTCSARWRCLSGSSPYGSALASAWSSAGGIDSASASRSSWWIVMATSHAPASARASKPIAASSGGEPAGRPWLVSSRRLSWTARPSARSTSSCSATALLKEATEGAPEPGSTPSPAGRSAMRHGGARVCGASWRSTPSAPRASACCFSSSAYLGAGWGSG